ncbi:MAG: ATP-binding protein [Candidatus Omnitrophica bacterium]|nr:ATP-binding protein [Candidatus Omnitrophota bacterium]
MIQTNPFTPQSGLEPKFFSGRESALGEFLILMEQAKDNRAEHFLVLGEWGVGKTSLLKQFKKIAQKQGFWTSFCGINKSQAGEGLIPQLSLIIEEIMLGLPLKDEELVLLRKEFKLKGKKSHSLQIEFAKFLLRVWQEIKSPLAFVFLDDVQNFLPHVEIIDILRATLSREDMIEKTKFSFLLSSTPQGWQNFLDKHDPVGRFFRRRIIIEPFNREEVFRFIEGSLEGTGVDFTSPIKEKVFQYTQGHPYEVQLLSSHLFDSQLNGKVDENSWEVALRNTLRDLGREYFEVLFHKASDREKELLYIFSEKNRFLSLSDLRSIMILERKAKNFPIANIKNFVYRLEDKGLLKRRENTFMLTDSLFREYILKFKQDEETTRGG